MGSVSCRTRTLLVAKSVAGARRRRRSGAHQSNPQTRLYGMMVAVLNMASDSLEGSAGDRDNVVDIQGPGRRKETKNLRELLVVVLK